MNLFTNKYIQFVLNSNSQMKLQIIILCLLLFFISCTNQDNIPDCWEDWDKVDQEFVVEGEVENYHPMRKDGHESFESFFVDTLLFAYSDFCVDGFYNNSCVYGGKICRNGQKVRIKFKTQCGGVNKITDIELLSDQHKSSNKKNGINY